jgi:hypothetical protein
MTTNELQNIVFVEGVSLCLISIIIVAAFKRWKITLCVSSVIATAAFFYAWAPIMALGSLLVYGPASILMWFELDKRTTSVNNQKIRIMRGICWALLATGVFLLILKNVFNIYKYLY